MAMEDSSMMSPADIAALTRGNTGFGGDGISWLVLILLFFGFMGGGWRSYRRQDVDATTKRRAVKDAMAKWVEWERKTKDLYSTSYKELLNDNAIDFADFVKENLVLDVSKELAFAESLYMELENCDYDMVYLAEIQPGYSKKFKK